VAKSPTAIKEALHEPTGKSAPQGMQAPREDGSPDWANVPFDVGCARCGADLRGQSEPKCKSCGLTFDWADAVPIEQLTCKKCGYHLCGLRETRCPECGTEFTWEEALARFHRQRLPYFEYRWRDRPIRSFVRTWWMSLRPRKFWRTMQLHDPPQMGGLFFHVLFAWLLFTGIMHVLNAGGEVVSFVHDGLAWFQQTGRAWVPYMLTYFRRGLLSPELTKVHVSLFAWWLSTLGAMLIFQQSMRRIQVRSAHVIRVWAYGVTPMLLAVTPIVFVISFGLILNDLDYQWGYLIFYFAGICIIACAGWSLWRAYCYYLKMPHGAGVVLAILVISFLVMMVADSLFIAVAGAGAFR